MCVLKEQGLEKWIQRLSDKPVVECRYCGAKANSLRNVCAVHLSEMAPDVEGSQGRVSSEEVGKPLAGQKNSQRSTLLFGTDHVYS